MSRRLLLPRLLPPLLLTFALPAALQAQSDPAPSPTQTQQGEPNPDTTAAVGLTFKDADIARAVQDFENGKVQEAIDFLTRLVKDKAARDQARTLELRTATAMLQIRTMDVKQKLAAMGILANIRPEDSNVARRAQVIRLAGDSKVKDGTKGIDDLKPRANWLEHLGLVKRYLENRIEESQKDLDRSVESERWGAVREALTHSSDDIERMEVIRLELEDQEDIINAHANVLERCARSANRKIDKYVREGDALREQLPKTDWRSIPAKRSQVNAKYREARQALDAAEDMLKARDELQGRYPKRIKRITVELYFIPENV